jgi:hypothetical protein
MRYHRFLGILLACMLSASVSAQSPTVTVERRDNHLRISAPQFHFIQGKALDKLHDGSTVHYRISLAAVAENTGSSAFFLQEQFAVSFDLWEEKFSVVQLGATGREASRLTAPQAEAWCLDNMPVPLRSVPATQPFMIKLTCEISEKDEEAGSKTESGATLAGLIEIFSRKEKEAPVRWEAATGFLRLGDLKNGR